MELGRHRLDWSRPVLLGVLNVTEDSFSDGGRFLSPDAAVRHAQSLCEQGADVIDVGGESTRPGAAAIDAEQECARVVPVVRALVREGMLVSIDTTKALVAAAAMDAGAQILNDVAMGDSIEALAPIVARHHGAYLRMHARGTPATMRDATHYPRGIVTEVCASLANDAHEIIARGVDATRVMLDPGIGFAKTAAQSIALLAAVPALAALGYPLCIGPSRKSFIDGKDAYASAWGAFASAPDQRVGGTAAAVTASILAGAHAVRVHDVFVMRQAARVAHAIALAAQEASAP